MHKAVAKSVRSPYVTTMFRIFILILSGLASFVIGPAQAAQTLERLQWQKRPLLLFSKSRSSATLDRQVDLLRDFRPELDERNMIVLRTSGSEETRSAIGYTSVDRGTSRNLTTRFKPEGSGLTVILVGKDGEEKARWQRVVQPVEIFEIIDAMPMRKQEIEENSAATN